jgi:hypothetical protein
VLFEKSEKKKRERGSNMKTKATQAALLLVCILCGLALIALAADPAKSAQSPNNRQSQRPPSGPTVVLNRQLRSTTLVYGDAEVQIPSNTYSPIDNPLKFTCPYASCTVTAELHVHSSSSGNESVLCAALDGVYMPPPGNNQGCPFTGELPTDARFSAFSFSFTQSGVAKGTHTLQSFVYVDSAAMLGDYSMAYRLYTP